MYVCMYVCICICIYIYMCVCVRLCKYVVILFIAPTGAVHLADLRITLQIQTMSRQSTMKPTSTLLTTHASPSSLI